MDLEVLLGNAGPFIRRNIIPIVFGLAGIVLLIYGLIQILITSNSSESLVIEKAAESSETLKSEIVVDIEGAVLKPGVYSLSADSRLHEVLVEAGGISGDADRQWFEKNINLASKLTDGQKIYIRRIGEDILTGASAVATGETQVAIDINSAGTKELDSLPGVGLVTAQKIIDNRPYQKIEDLLTKKVVSSRVFDSIKDKIAAN